MDSPEAALWHAVILQALEDLGYEQRRQPALRWFLSSTGQVGSFRWVCHQLDLDPSAVRKSALNRSTPESLAPAQSGTCDLPATFESEISDPTATESPSMAQAPLSGE
jgi:hypothetical protein